MDEAKDTGQPSLETELIAKQVARNKADVAKWSLNSVIFLFALLITIIILTSLGIGPIIVSTVAILGLGAVWFMGWRRGEQLYQLFFNAELSNLRGTSGEKGATLVAQLTSREIQALSHAAMGYSNKRIALELYISERTVKNYITRILTKLNANDRTEAVVIAIKHGLITIR